MDPALVSWAALAAYGSMRRRKKYLPVIEGALVWVMVVSRAGAVPDSAMPESPMAQIRVRVAALAATTPARTRGTNARAPCHPRQGNAGSDDILE